MKAPIEKILPNPENPRTVFDQEELEGLAASIKKYGVIQPLVVEQEQDYYILVAGERRLRASKLAGLAEVPITIQESTNHGGLDRLTKALIENVQRSQMGPVDVAKAYQRLLKHLGTHQAVADEVGVTGATVSVHLALLEFPEEVLKLFNLGKLPMDARLFPRFKRLPKTQLVRIALRAATRGLTAKGILSLIKRETNGQKVYTPRKRASPEPVLVDGHFSALSLLGGKELPENVRAAALKTCQGCPLYPEASPSMCRECPLPDFLRRL